MLLVGVLALGILVTRLFLSNTGSDNLLFCPASSTWAHKSYKAYPAESSYVRSLTRVMESKFCGVELDIIWHPNGFFYVAHDPFPSYENIPDEIMLEHILKELGNKNIHWWLDWKNPDLGNIVQASNVLDSLAAKYLTSSNYLFVESAKLFSLSAFAIISSHRIRPIFWITKSDSSTLHGFLANARSIVILLFRPKYVSMGDSSVRDTWSYLFGENKQFIFTVNDPARIRELFRQNFSVVLTDLNEPVLP